MLSFSQIRTWRSAQKYQIENIEAWFWNHPTAIAKEEQEFVRKAGDVVALVARVKSPLRLLLEKFRSVLTCSMFRAKQRVDGGKEGLGILRKVDKKSTDIMLLIGRYMFRMKAYACATLCHLEWKLGETLRKRESQGSLHRKEQRKAIT